MVNKKSGRVLERTFMKIIRTGNKPQWSERKGNWINSKVKRR